MASISHYSHSLNTNIVLFYYIEMEIQSLFANFMEN